MIEYEKQSEAEDIIKRFNNTEFMGRTIHVSWAFSRGPQRRQAARYGLLVVVLACIVEIFGFGFNVPLPLLCVLLLVISS